MKNIIIAVLLALLITTTIGCGEKGNPIIVLETNMGTMEIEMYPFLAPLTVENFIKLTEEGFYDSLIFHRVMDRFMIQCGDPEGTGMGGSENNVVAEFSDSIFHIGTIAMARRGNDVNSATSQFFICITDASSPSLKGLNGKYTIFGKTVSGLDVALKIGKVATSGGIQRIMADSTWRAELLRLKNEEGADVNVIPSQNNMIQPDRPLQPVRIIKAYLKK